jgi:DNA-binding CsgD family transcriptional regulator
MSEHGGGAPAGRRSKFGDADRERLVALLREHYAAGRLDLDDLRRRVGVVLAAANAEQATVALADLPPAGVLDTPAAGRRRGSRWRHAEASEPEPGWMRTAERFRDPSSGVIMRVWIDPSDESRHYVPDDAPATTVLTEVGDLLEKMVVLDLSAGRYEEAALHLREALQTALRTGVPGKVLEDLDCCGYLCALTGRPAEAVTVWAAVVVLGREGFSVPLHPDLPEGRFQRQESLREARQALGPARARAAEERGKAMSLATAADYVLMLTAAGPEPPVAAPGLDALSPRERELVTLVARGHTDAQIAEQLHISVRTVSSHLDRIRDKTGCRRRADLTRLALNAGRHAGGVGNSTPAMRPARGAKRPLPRTWPGGRTYG